MTQPVLKTIALVGEDADGISVSQTVPAAGTLAISGALSTGSSANNVCTTQSTAGAANLTLNGSTVSGGIAYLYGKAVQIISAADDSDITFTVIGTAMGINGPYAVSQTITGGNTTRVATSALFHQITSISTSAATSGNVTVGTNGTAVIASAGTGRQVLVTSGGSDAGITFTVTGTNVSGKPLTETFAGGASTATSVNYFQSVTSVTASGASASTVTVGTNQVGATEPICLAGWTQAPTALQVVLTGTANFTVQQTLTQNYNAVENSEVTWFSHPDSALAAASASAQGNYAYAPTFTRLKVNTGTGALTYTVMQSGGVSQ